MRIKLFLSFFFLVFSALTTPVMAENTELITEETFRSALDGDREAQFAVGNSYYNDQEDVEAVKWFRKAADQGVAEAQTMLGLMYENGHGVPQDHKKAVRWYRKATEQGDAKAQSNLGFMYLKGLGLTQDDKEAVKWFGKAA